MTAGLKGSAANHLRVRVSSEQFSALRNLAKRQHLSLSHLLRGLIDREVSDADASSGSVPDESAIRDMAILVAVELLLKLQEASIPGGATLSRRLLEEAARAAIERLEMVGLSLERATQR